MNLQSFHDEIDRAARMIKSARHMVVFTGAGISTPSGIPDFRGEKEGLWQRYDPMQVASRSAFYQNPKVFFDWFRPLFLTSWKAQPNPAHLGLAALEARGLCQSVITQNIDGLHQKAGSHKVLELHGSALTFACSKCECAVPSEQVYDQFISGVMMPRCENCEGMLKPDVVLFEEPLPAETWQEAEQEAFQTDLILVIGSSLEVYPACTIPESALRRGSRMILNNLSPTRMDVYANLRIPMDAAEFIPRLVQRIEFES